MTSVVPATLLRVLSKHAAHEHVDRDIDDNDKSNLSIGVLLGVHQQKQPQQSVTPATNASIDSANALPSVAIWGLLRREADLDMVTPSLPAGVSALGHFAVLERAADTASIAACAQRIRERRTQPHDGVILVFVRASASPHLFYAPFGPSNAPLLQPLALDTIDCLHARDYLTATRYALLRCAFSVEASAVQHWQQQLNDDVALFFRLASNPIVVLDSDGYTIVDRTGSTQRSLTLAEWLDAPAVAAEKKNKNKKNKKNSNNATAQQALDAWGNESPNSNSNTADVRGSPSAHAPLETLDFGAIPTIELLQSMNPVALSTAQAPILTLPAANAPATTPTPPVRFEVDVVVLVSLDASVRDALQLVRQQLSQQLCLLAQCAHESNSAAAHHYALRGAAFPLTLIASGQMTGTTGQNDRISTALLQPSYAPRLSPLRNSLVVTAAAKHTSLVHSVLLNVHEGIAASGIVNGHQYLVEGFYGYFHYLQHDVNDKGWGCAYRSLQTLASWLELNGYVPAECAQTGVPTHDAIQRTLVSIGDKPTSFIGSREWIGSMEVGYVLDELYGVTFRSLSAANGPQLVDLAQELKNHFETQGTPVMIGGGQLAFTLLGIDYCASSGECAFLILDPHYTGSDDLEVIQTKVLALEGYKAVACSWRRASTFAKNSFYNLCLPQRPHV